MIRAMIAVASVLALVGCASPMNTGNSTPVVNEYDSQGRLVRQTVQVSGDQYVTAQAVMAKSGCQQTYYSIPTAGQQPQQAQGVDPQMVWFAHTLNQVMRPLTVAVQALNPNDPCPTPATPTDARMARNAEIGKTFRSLVPWASGAYVGGEAVKNRDPVVVEQPAPQIVRPEVVSPEIVSPEVITTD